MLAPVRRRSAAALVLPALAFALAGCGPAEVAGEGPTAELSEAIKGGEVDPTDKAVVAFVNLVDGSLCSGSLIAPNLVLTARHCVSNVLDTVDGGVDCEQTHFDDIVRPDAFFVTTATTVTKANIGQFRVHDIIGLPESRRMVCGDDVAMLILQENVDAKIATPYEPRVAEAIAKGDTYTAIGYGATDDGSTGAGTRRIRKDLAVSCVGKACDPTIVTKTEFVGETGVCHGDSGGPALDAEGRVAGVVSRGKLGCDAPVYGHVRSFADFIKDTAVIASGWGKYEAPAWAAGSKESPQHGMAVGEECAADADCFSGHCILPGGYCSRECDDTAKCPVDYECRPEAPRLCVDPSAPSATPKASYGTSPGRDDGEGCAMGRGAGGAAGGVALVAALALAARRRRR
jgi:hypothetical protein